MTRVLYGMALTFGLILVLGMVAPVSSGMMGQRPMGQPEGTAEPSPGGMMGMMGQGGQGMMGPQMMQSMMRGMTGAGMHGMPEGMGMPRPGSMIRMLKQELGLSEDQAKQARTIFYQMMKTNIKQRADLRVGELELQELLEVEPVDLTQVEAKLKAIEACVRRCG